jgi:arylformamidase
MYVYKNKEEKQLKHDFVLFKTNNSFDEEFNFEFVFLTGSGVIVIEGLRLKDVPQGEYFMVAAPLKLIGTDAAPARVLLFEGM